MNYIVYIYLPKVRCKLINIYKTNEIFNLFLKRKMTWNENIISLFSTNNFFITILGLITLNSVMKYTSLLSTITSFGTKENDKFTITILQRDKFYNIILDLLNKDNILTSKVLSYKFDSKQGYKLENGKYTIITDTLGNTCDVTVNQEFIKFESNNLEQLKNTISNCTSATVDNDDTIAIKIIIKSHENKFIWCTKSQIRKRPLDSIVLRKGLKEDITRDIDEFLNSKDFFMKKYISYHFGFLFYGVVGSGKTSFISSLAGHYNKDLYYFSLQSEMNNYDIIDLITKTSKDSIIVFEDIDRYINCNSQLLSTLLNLIDGIDSENGRILFFTANDVTKLPKEFLRRGRCDRVIQFSYADRYQCLQLFQKFFIEEDESDSKSTFTVDSNVSNTKSLNDKSINMDFANKVAQKLILDDSYIKRADKGEILNEKYQLISMVQLQEFFIQHKNNPLDIIDHIDGFKESLRNEKSQVTNAVF